MCLWIYGSDTTIIPDDLKRNGSEMALAEYHDNCKSFADASHRFFISADLRGKKGVGIDLAICPGRIKILEFATGQRMGG